MAQRQSHYRNASSRCTSKRSKIFLIEIKLQTPSITIGASYGDTLMAMIGINHIRDFSEAKKLIETGKVYYPNLENTKKYKPYYRIYIELYKQNKELMTMMDEIN